MNFQQNNLEVSSSPYLLQHQSNPVWWQEWSDEVLAYAVKENKPLLISVGYSACHWCHVMEKECFEDHEVAELMNHHFVCIKVDREERPDIDHVYMNAVQLMNRQGGWPLNVFALPNGKPIFGGTYFPKQRWMSLLEQVARTLTDKPSEFADFANQITGALNAQHRGGGKVKLNSKVLEKVVENWKKSFDNEWGATKRAPKFPMPVAFDFLLEYGHLANDAYLSDHVETSLQRMQQGGIFDQIGGGFARYSVDEFWKVPHFEKMLYDNAQLLALYAKAYRWRNRESFKETIHKTIAWLNREMMDSTGAYYAALDADSEGEEGKFYVWSESELLSMELPDYQLFKVYYCVGDFGYWEHGNNILFRKFTDQEFCKKYALSLDRLNDLKQQWQSRLLDKRNLRERPGLDHKILTSWNALLAIGFLEVYKTFADEQHLQSALGLLDFILSNQFKEGVLYRNYNDGESSIPGFLEDYAIVFSALILAFEVTGKQSYFRYASDLKEVILNQFWNSEASLFQFSSNQQEALVAETFETFDTVIPSSNAIMAINLFKFSRLSGEMSVEEQYVLPMLNSVVDHVENYPESHAHWLKLMMMLIYDFKEIVVVGDQFQDVLKKLQSEFINNNLMVGTNKEWGLGLFNHRKIKGKTLIYVCQNNTCSTPAESLEAALALLSD